MSRITGYDTPSPLDNLPSLDNGIGFERVDCKIWTVFQISEFCWRLARIERPLYSQFTTSLEVCLDGVEQDKHRANTGVVRGVFMLRRNVLGPKIR